MTWNGSAKVGYLDGVAETSAQVTVGLDSNNLTIGGDLNTGVPALQYSGALDEVRLYDRALTLTEVMMLAAESR
jgi:hypothetical protein